MFSWARRLLGAVADATPFVACMNRHGKNARGCAVGGSTMVDMASRDHTSCGIDLSTCDALFSSDCLCSVS